MSENKITNINEENSIPNAVAITVDDGRERVPVFNKQGDEIGVFYFNPTDLGMIDRYNSMVDDFDNITAPLENITINPDGTVDENNEAALSAMSEAVKNLYAACDKLFDGNVSEAFFGKTHPFSPINGHFYCENALEALGQFISKQFARETKQINNRVKKYTHGYAARTGKHKNGKHN